MGILELSQLYKIAIAVCIIFFTYLSWNLLFLWWISPLRRYYRLRRNGFGGPTPRFPFGNTCEMRKEMTTPPKAASSAINHDIHSTALPYFARWQNSYGKVYIYWLGTEPFLYVAEPEFLRRMTAGVMGKTWGKPRVFKNDREPMFGNGLVMVEGDNWVHRRHVITPAFSPLNLKEMASLMVESATMMLDKWTHLTMSGDKEIDIEREIIATAGDIIAKASFGISYQGGSEVFEKLKAVQMTLFKSNRYVGVPFAKYLMNPRETLKAKRLGKEIDALLMAIIEERKANSIRKYRQRDLLGLLLEAYRGDGKSARGKTLTTRELVDECKTFFFGGHETTALALTWTLMLLAMHQNWQAQLREEIEQVLGDHNKEIDFTMLAGLKKMGWVMSEVLRLYPPAPNAQRQAKEEIQVGDQTIPTGTNIWIDIVSMHHDRSLWGADVNEFKPERFKDDSLYGGCRHKMGYLPFGFGGRMCIGRNLTMMEYKIVLTLLLSRFSFALSKTYSHSPSTVLSLRPLHGLPLIVSPLKGSHV